MKGILLAFDISLCVSGLVWVLQALLIDETPVLHIKKCAGKQLSAYGALMFQLSLIVFPFLLGYFSYQPLYDIITRYEDTHGVIKTFLWLLIPVIGLILAGAVCCFQQSKVLNRQRIIKRKYARR